MRLVSGGCGSPLLKRRNSLLFKQKTSDRRRINITRRPNERWQIFTPPIFSSGLFSAPLYLPAVSPKRLSLAISMQARWDLAIDSRRHHANVRAQTAKWLLWPSSNKARLTHACWGQRPLGSEERVGLVGSQTSRLTAGQQRRINWEARLLKMKLTPFVIWLTTSGNFPLMSWCSMLFLNYGKFANYCGIRRKMMNDKDALFHFLKMALQKRRRSINGGISLQKRQRIEQEMAPRLLFY